MSRLLHPRHLLVSTGLLVTCVACCPPLRAVAAPAVTCDGLSTTLSDDKNFYIFTVTAGGDTGSISGYTFNFGDHQSYQFNFGASTSQDHHTANVTHTYKKSGTYTATATARVKNGSKTTGVTSPECRTTVTNGPSAAVLPSVGNQGTVRLFSLVAVIGMTAYQLHLRLRNRGGILH